MGHLAQPQRRARDTYTRKVKWKQRKHSQLLKNLQRQTTPHLAVLFFWVNCFLPQVASCYRPINTGRLAEGADFRPRLEWKEQKKAAPSSPWDSTFNTPHHRGCCLANMYAKNNAKARARCLVATTTTQTLSKQQHRRERERVPRARARVGVN